MHELVLVNNYYPIGYFSSVGLDQPTPQSADEYWASVEKLAPEEDWVEYDLGRDRPVNFIDFQICQKPIDFKVEAKIADEWQEVEVSDFFPVTQRVEYHSSVENSWHYFEMHFDLVTTRYIRVTFTRRTDPFPFSDSTPFPWSIELRNLRLMHVVPDADAFVVDSGEDILGNTYVTDLVKHDSTALVDFVDTAGTLTVSGNEITDSVRAVGLSGDGLINDSSYGIWKDSTNLLPNSGFETNITGWVASTTGGDGAISRSTTRSRFGVASGRLTCSSGTLNAIRTTGFTFSPSTTYTVSGWFYIESLGSGVTSIALSAIYNSGPQLSAIVNLDLNLIGQWQFVKVTFTTNAGSQAGTYVDAPRINGAVTSSTVVHMDGLQVETGSFATPYIPTDGGTATRAGARVQANSSVFDEFQGWIACRMRLSGTPSSSARIMEWGDYLSDWIGIFYEGGSWQIGRHTNTNLNRASFTDSVSAGDIVTVIAAWTATHLMISSDGNPFSMQEQNDIPAIPETQFDIGSSGSANHINSEVLWFAAGSGTMPDADLDAFDVDTLPDRTSLPGRATLTWEADTADYIFGEELDPSTYWQSQPNPSRFAVESLYFDLRYSAEHVTMAFLNEHTMEQLNGRTMADMEVWHSEGALVDEIYIDPITFGPSMHIYYSNDDEGDWDNKLWTPVPRQYTLKKGFHALPAPTYTKYIKLEFTDLAATPYNLIEYPSMPPVRYRKHPTWVQNYFTNQYITQVDNSSFYNPVDRVSIDPLELGFRKPDDYLGAGSYMDRTLAAIEESEEELKEFIEQLSVDTDRSQIEQIEVERQINYRPSFVWQQDLIDQLDETRALTRFAKDGDTGWNAEELPVVEPEPTLQSMPDLSEAIDEKKAPVMWFPRKCRHQYQIVEAARPSKVAYFVAVREVSFHRRNYEVEFDEEFYIESLDDEANIETNDFERDDWRFVI